MNDPPPPAEYRCTLIVPTYNAADFIVQTARRLRAFVTDRPDWCVLFVCDGCSDDTVARLSAELAARPCPHIRVEAYVQNRGKGYALRRGFDLAQTPFAVYTDVDLAYDPEEALKILRLLEDGADVALANRVDPDTRFLISPRDFPSIYRRHRMSRAFNWWLRQMLPIRALDTQAGLKGMTARAWERLKRVATCDGFFCDVELLAWAGAMKMSVAETAVSFRYIDPTTVRMIRHGRSMLMETLRLRRRMRRARVATEAAGTPTPELTFVRAALPRRVAASEARSAEWALSERDR